MLEQLAQILILFLCYVVRMVVLFRTLPIMGTNIIPQQALVALAAVLLLPVIYGFLEDAPQNLAFDMHLAFLLLKEVFIGLVLGLLFSLLFWVAQSVGYLVDNQRGASQAEGTDPFSGDRLTPFASLLFQSVTMLFFSSGIIFSLLAIIYESYRVWPVFAMVPQFLSLNMLAFLVTKAGEYMTLVVAFSGPILIVCFLSDFCLGIINRFAQQLNVFSLSMPIKSALVLFILFLYANGMFTEFHTYVHNMQAMFFDLRSISHE